MKFKKVSLRCEDGAEAVVFTNLGVRHTLDEAKTIFNNHVIKEKEYASEQGWTVFEDKDTVF